MLDKGTICFSCCSGSVISILNKLGVRHASFSDHQAQSRHVAWEIYGSHPTYMSLSLSIPLPLTFSTHLYTPPFFVLPLQTETLWLFIYHFHLMNLCALLFAFLHFSLWCVGEGLRMYLWMHIMVRYGTCISPLFTQHCSGQELKSRTKQTTWLTDIWNGVFLAFTISMQVIHLVMFGVAVDRVDWTELFYERSVYITTWTLPASQAL